MFSKVLPLVAYRDLVDCEVGRSTWVAIDQKLVDDFAKCTSDRQFVHVDPARAAATVFGGTIAHGFLTLSLLSAFAYDAVPAIEGAKMTMNYGLDSIRFLAPVRTGRSVRGVFTLDEAVERRAGEWRSTFRVTVEIDDQASKPALVAKWLTLSVL